MITGSMIIGCIIIGRMITVRCVAKQYTGGWVPPVSCVLAV